MSDYPRGIRDCALTHMGIVLIHARIAFNRI
jgi:hypothetical protein